MKPNILNKLEEYIKRSALAEIMGTPVSYLSVVAKKRDEDIPSAYKERIVAAAEEIVEEVEEILEADV